MKTFKRFAFWIVGYLLRFVLFATVTVAVAFAVAGNAKTIKAVLNNNKSYEQIVPAIIETNKASPQSAWSLPYDDQKIVEIFEQSFPSSDLRLNSEKIIDSTFAWLSGTTPTLDFKVDLSANKATLADKLTTYSFVRLAHLPPCKTLPSEINPLAIQCQPAGYNSQEIQDSYRNQLLKSDAFLIQPVLTAKDLPKNGAGKNIAQQYSYAPTVYQLLKISPYILGTLMVVLVIAFVLLSPKKRRGISALGSILMSTGIGLAVLPIIYDVIISKFLNHANTARTSASTQQIISDITDQVYKHFNSLLITVGIQLALAGITIYMLEKLTRNETAKYKGISKKTGMESSNLKPKANPKSLRGALSTSNIPLQSSDLPAKLNPKKVAENNKYRKLYKKKGL